jgi:hypothetical protein
VRLFVEFRSEQKNTPTVVSGLSTVASSNIAVATPPVAPMPGAVAQSAEPTATPTTPEGQSELGFNYRHGSGGVQQDLGKAVVWYQKAADQGYAEAQFRLGSLYEDGLGVAVDWDQAKAWYQKAENQGNTDAVAALKRLKAIGSPASLAELARTTPPVAPMPAPVVSAAPEATATTPYRQYEMGYNYFYGLYGFNKNYEQAKIWYQKAADQGYPGAQVGLGNLYEHALGVGKDYGQAKLWYQKAADQGYAEAQFRLGELYRDGLGVLQSYDQAKFWYRKAAEQGNIEAKSALQRLDGAGDTEAAQSASDTIPNPAELLDTDSSPPAPKKSIKRGTRR